MYRNFFAMARVAQPGVPGARVSNRCVFRLLVEVWFSRAGVDGRPRLCSSALSALRSVEERPFRAALRSPSTPVFLSDPEGAHATEGESKDPDTASCTMPHQGVRSKLSPYGPARLRLSVGYQSSKGGK